MHRHHDDLGCGHLLGNGFTGGDAVNAGHVDVHQDDVGLKLLGHLDALFAADGRPDDLDVVFEVEKLAQIFPRLRYVIHDQDPDFFFSVLGHLLWFPQLSERAVCLSFKCKSRTSHS